MDKEVKVLKLVSGEEVITRIKNHPHDTESKTIVCEKPMTTQPVPVQGGQMAMGISPWMFAGKRDDVPTMLMGGEFVVNKRAVQKYGPNFLNALNMGAIQGMARGGFFTPGTYGQGAITGKSEL